MPYANHNNITYWIRCGIWMHPSVCPRAVFVHSNDGKWTISNTIEDLLICIAYVFSCMNKHTSHTVCGSDWHDICSILWQQRFKKYSANTPNRGTKCDLNWNGNYVSVALIVGNTGNSDGFLRLILIKISAILINSAESESFFLNWIIISYYLLCRGICHLLQNYYYQRCDAMNISTNSISPNWAMLKLMCSTTAYCDCTYAKHALFMNHSTHTKQKAKLSTRKCVESRIWYLFNHFSILFVLRSLSPSSFMVNVHMHERWAYYRRHGLNAYILNEIKALNIGTVTSVRHTVSMLYLCTLSMGSTVHTAFYVPHRTCACVCCVKYFINKWKAAFILPA